MEVLFSQMVSLCSCFVLKALPWRFAKLACLCSKASKFFPKEGNEDMTSIHFDYGLREYLNHFHFTVTFIIKLKDLLLEMHFDSHIL